MIRIDNLPFLAGLAAESSRLTGVSPYEVKGLGTDRLRTGGRCPVPLCSKSLPRLGVEGGVFFGIRLTLALPVPAFPPAGFDGDPFCVDSSTPESASASEK